MHWHNRVQPHQPPYFAGFCKQTRMNRRRKDARLSRPELLEPRRPLAADVPLIQVGAVYLETDAGTDEVGDEIQITFQGGAPGTELTRLEIDGDKLGNGLTIADIYFDTSENPPGAFSPVPLSISEAPIIDGEPSFVVTGHEITDGGTSIVFQLSGFTAGDRLTFRVDVDERGFDDTGDFDTALAEGGEFAGSWLRARFQQPHYHDSADEVRFVDHFNEMFDEVGQGGDGPLDLPTDEYPTASDPNRQNRTAGAAMLLEQIPLPVAISGRVYVDDNLNLQQDSNESGIPQVSLELLNELGSVVQTTTTDSLGDYEFFVEEPGIYSVREIQPAPFFSVGAVVGSVAGESRGGLVPGDPDRIVAIELFGGETSVQNDFAEARPGSLAGHVYHDADNDGIRDAGETGIANVEIQVVLVESFVPASSPGNSGTVFTTTTAADGSWAVGGLLPGTYSVFETQQPTPYIDGLDSEGTLGGSAVNPGDRIIDIRLDSGAAGHEYNFGEILPGGISGLVHADTDGDCILDAGEAPIAGVVIQLLNADGDLIDEVFTDSGGRYEFSNLPPGEYRIREIQPLGFFDGMELAGSAGGFISGDDEIAGIILSSGTVGENYNFCEHPPARIGGRVFVDENDNDLQDEGEPGIADVVIQLRDSDTGQLVAEVTTAADGSYSFDELESGRYTIREIQPAAFIDSGEQTGNLGGIVGDDELSDIAINYGDVGQDYDFWEIRPAGLMGRVYIDSAGEGDFDPSDTPLAGVVVELLDEIGNVITSTETDIAGKYKFDGLAPGKYGVREIQPAGLIDAGERVGTAGGIAQDDLITMIMLMPGVMGQDYDFWELEPSSLSGRVHADLNGDCIFDPNEVGLAGARIELSDELGMLLQVTFTDADGNYRFDGLPPGTYVVREIQPEGYFHLDQHVGTAGGEIQSPDVIGEIVLGPGTDAAEYNFCEEPPVSLSGYVFQDGPQFTSVDGSLPEAGGVYGGNRTPDDTPIMNVDIRLFDMQGNLISQTRTDASGFYEFAGLRSGIYEIRESQPEGFEDWIDSAGSLGGVADSALDRIAEINLRPGSAGTEYNFSEIVTGPIVFIPPVTVQSASIDPPPEVPVPLAAPRPIPLPKPLVRPESQSFFGSQAPVAYTWHLSVVDAGHPRGIGRGNAVDAESLTGRVVWTQSAFRPISLLVRGDREPSDRRAFGLRDGIPVTGDFNGDGITEFGMFYQGHWFIDINANGVWDDGDLWAQLGDENDRPVTGDWDGDGKTDIGIFGPIWQGDMRAVPVEPGLPDPLNHIRGKSKNLPPGREEATDGERVMKLTSRGQVRRDLIDHVFLYGHAHNIPVVGDWDGDGIDTIAIFRNGRWRLDHNGDGRENRQDLHAVFGASGDIPLAGDFDGNGVDEVAIYRNGTWVIDSNRNFQIDAQDRVFELSGGPDGIPVIGDWNGDGRDEPSIYIGGEEMPELPLKEVPSS